MEIKNLTTGGYASNCFLVIEGGDAVLVDATVPGNVLKETLDALHCRLHAILLTHGHFDHMLTLEELKKEFAVPVYLHADEADAPADATKNASAFFFGRGFTFPSADLLLKGGEALSFGNLSLSVMHTPGHTRGSVLYLFDGIAFTGDTIFARGYGRTDLFGGNAAQLRASLQAISTLPSNTVIYPGHGESEVLDTALSALF